jgi:YD repeat-containing protein
MGPLGGNAASGTWTVTFVGTHSGINVPKLNGDASNLVSGTLERTISYAYDAADRLTSASDPDSGYEYTYDNLNRVLTIDNDDTPDVPQVMLTNAYDVSGNRTSLSVEIDTTDDFLNSYSYDGLHRLTRVDQVGQSSGNEVAEKRVDFVYNAMGQFSQIARYKDTDGGTSNEIATGFYSYDTLNRLTGLAYKNDGTKLFTPYAYTFDKLTGSLGAGLPTPPNAHPIVAALAGGAVFSGAGRIRSTSAV